MDPNTTTALPEVAKAVLALTEDFQGLTGELKSRMDQADAERKTIGGASEEAKAAIATLTSHYEDLRSELAEKSSELRDLQLDIARRGTHDGGDAPAKSLGAQFAESQEVKNFVERKERNSAPFQVKGTLTLAGNPGLVEPQRLDMVAPAQRGLTIRDLLPVLPAGTGELRFPRETGFYADAAPGDVTGITQTGGVATVTTDDPHGLSVGGWVIIAGADQADYNGTHRVRQIISATVFTIVVPSGTTSPATGTITFRNAQTHGGAAPVAEGSPKPASQLDIQMITYPAETIAHHINASRQIIADARQLAAYIDQRMLYGLMRAEERQILYGDGNSPNLHGLMTDPDALTYLWSEGQVGDQKGDAIRRAITRVEISDYSASGIVAHALDWEDVELAKSNDGQYLYIQGYNATGMPAIWRVPVVVTNAIQPGTALVGSFAQAAALYDREDASIRVSEEHGENFTHNEVTILAEERVALVTYRPEAFVKVAFDDAPSS